jgi:glycosyltransferase involved in cell wall biosynthesis
LVQWVSDLAPDDAIGQQALLIHRLFARQGWESSLVCSRQAGKLPMNVSVHPVGPAGVPPLPTTGTLLFHHSIGSPLADSWTQVNGTVRRVVFYHNVTPPNLLRDTPLLAAAAHWGLRQLPQVVQAADLVLGASHFNLEEARLCGARQCRAAWMAPPPERMAALQEVERQRNAAGRNPDPMHPRLLAIGRLVPSKNLRAAVECMRSLMDQIPGCQPELRLVGPWTDPGEPQRLRLRQRELGLPESSLQIPGPLSMDGLCEQWLWADILLQPSLHEGFGMPPVEAMHAGVPVIGSSSGALPEVTAGVCPLVPGANPATTALRIAELLQSGDDYRRVVEAQARRAREHFTPEKQAHRLLEAIAPRGAPTLEP